jgi:hypothetical protein
MDATTTCHPTREKDFFIDNLLFRIHFIIVVMNGSKNREGLPRRGKPHGYEDIFAIEIDIADVVPH